MNVRCACWTGCIRACGWTGWNGWNSWQRAWFWWNGWNGANGWQVIYAYMHWTPETICVNGWAWGCWGCGWSYWSCPTCDWTDWTAWTDWRKLVYMVSTDLDLARFISTHDEEYLLRLLSSESWIEAVAWSTEALEIIANDTELLSDVLSYSVIVNAMILDSTCLWYIAWSHTSMVLVKDNTTIMNALIVDSTALWAISQQDFFDYVLENETFLATCVWSTAWANKVNSIDADDLLEPIYFYTWDLWYDSWTTLSEDDDAMETLENNTNAMLIIESNDEAYEYFGALPIPQMTQNSQDWYIATESTQLSSDFQPWYAFYKSIQWQSYDPNPCFHSPSIWSWNRAWSMIELPRKSKPNKILIGARRNETSANLRPIGAFELQWSNDWTNFTTIFSKSWLWNTWSIWSDQQRTFENNNSYKYFRLRVQAYQQYVSFDYWNLEKV